MALKSEKARTIFKVISIIIIIAIILLLIPLALSLPYSIQYEKEHKAAYKDFQSVCEYVRENQNIFEEFSEYQLSLINDNQPFDIEKEGEYQEQRDVIFKYVDSANVNIDMNGITFVYYHAYSSSSSYDIVITYEKNRTISHESKGRFYIGDNLTVAMVRMRTGI